MVCLGDFGQHTSPDLVRGFLIDAVGHRNSIQGAIGPD